MRQIVTVKRQTDETHAEVYLVRASACSGDCHTCGGCGAAKETVFVTAENPIHAREGDRVMVETDTKAVYSAIAVVYLLPMLLFFIGYSIGLWAACLPGLWGFLGFCMGIAGILLYNRREETKKTMRYRIVAFIERSGDAQEKEFSI